MKKFLTFILVLAMILSVSGVALAVEACTDAACTTPHVASISTAEYHSLQDAVDAAYDSMTGDVTITVLVDTLSESVKIIQKSGLNLTVDGDGVTMDDANIGVSGVYSFGSGNTLVIKNFNFDIDSTSIDKCIYSYHAYATGDAAGKNHDVHDMTISGCTFDMHDNCVAVKLVHGNNNTISGCIVTSGHSLLQNTGGKKITVSGTTVNAQRGISFGTATDCKVEGSSITAIGADKYGIRGDASGDNGSVAISNTTVSAAQPVVVRQANGTNGYEVSVGEDNTITPAEGNDWCTIYSAGDDPENKVDNIPANITVPSAASAVAKIGSKGYASLQEAIHAAQGMTGDVTIELLADNAETVHVLQKEGLDLVIDGAKSADEKYKMTGQIKIYGDARYTGAETLTIQNIAFEKDSGDAIYSDELGDITESCCSGHKMQYAHNVTIQNCTFTGDAIVGTRIRQGYNINIIDCVMNSGHSLMQNTNNTGITIKGTTINATEGGLNLFASTGVLVEGCDITAGDYGVRVNADGNGSATIKDSKIDANKPAIIRNVSDKYDMTANEGNVFTVGDGNLPVNIETGSGTVTYTDNFAAMNGTTNTYYNGMDEAIADAQPGETVYPVVNGDPVEDGAVTIPNPESKPASSGSGIKVKYEGGNSFSTSKSAVPTSVEIDGVPVSFTGNGKFFTVGCIDPGAKWVTVRWNSTSVTVNFKPDVTVSCPVMSIPKTGDMPVWAAIAEFFGF